MAKNSNIQVSATAEASVMNNTATAASISFPTAWTGRVQTPIKRPNKGDISAYANDMPTTWGGPQR
jgi:hypothetical protein